MKEHTSLKTHKSKKKLPQKFKNISNNTIIKMTLKFVITYFMLRRKFITLEKKKI